MLDEKNKAAVKDILSKMKDDVEVMFFTSKDCKYCPNEKKLLSDIAKVSNLKIKELDLKSEEAKKYGVEHAPAVIFSKNPQIRFVGLPSGHEFRNFLDTILMVSGHDTEIKDEVKEGLKELKEPVDIKVFVTPTCPYCPAAVHTAHQFAALSDKVTSTMIEATEFPELSQKHGVMSVPKIVINDNKSWEGAVPEHIFLKKIKEAL